MAGRRPQSTIAAAQASPTPSRRRQTFPVVATIFPASGDFSSACFRAAAHTSDRLVATTLPSGSTLVSCPHRPSAAASDPPCSFRLLASPLPDNAPRVRVVEACSTHSCQVRGATNEERKTGDERGDASPQAEVDEAHGAVSSKRGGTTLSGHEPPRKTVKRVQPAECEPGAAKRTSAADGMVREKEQPSTVEESEESVDAHLAQAGELLPDVKRLASSGCVLLPGPSEPHNSLRELLVSLYAWAAQRSILVERAHDAHEILCQRKGSGEVDTAFRLDITRGDDGAWRVRRTAAHAAPRPKASGGAQQLKPAEVAPPSPMARTVKLGSAKRKRAACDVIDLTTSPPPSTCLDAPQQAAPVPRRPSPSPLLVRLRLPSTCSLTASPPSSTNARRGSTSSSAAPLAAPFSAQLIALLAMLVPFIPIQQHLDAAEALVGAGVSTHSELAALCCLSCSARNALVETLVEEGARARAMSEEAAQGMRRSLMRILDALGRAKDEAAETE